MAILIKSMEMPPTCYFCPMTNDGFYLCKANNPYRQLEEDCEERRPSWCPLVPVPPHGDLIDRDALRDNNCDAFEINGADGTILAMDVSIIDDAPIIIPADPADEGE